jgi:hypothetical protein
MFVNEITDFMTYIYLGTVYRLLAIVKTETRAVWLV